MERRDVSAQFRDGGPAAVRAIYREYGRLVFAVAYRVLGDPDLAEEATQHTFLMAWRAAGSLPADRELGTWLASIARRGAIEVSRQRAVPAADPIDSVVPGDPALATRPESMEAIYDVWAVREAIAGLPAQEREIVRLQHHRGLSQGEISDKLNMAVGTVNSRSLHAHKRLAAVLALAFDERAEVDEVSSLLDDQSVWTEPPPELEDRVVTAIADEDRVVTAIADEDRAARRAAASTPSASERAPAPQRPAASFRRQRPAHKPKRRFPSVLLESPKHMAGALAGLVAIIAVVTLLTTNGGSTPNSQLRFTMVVNGTDLVPAAHGSATLVKESSGWQITLKASGLPHLDNGRYYQAWLRNPAGITVPIGTFNDAVDVTLWSGVPVTQFRTLTVTREQADGNPASPGQRMLTGTI